VITPIGWPMSILRLLHRIDRVAERGAGRQVEGDGGGWKLSEMRDLQRRGLSRILAITRRGTGAPPTDEGR